MHCRWFKDSLSKIRQPQHHVQQAAQGQASKETISPQKLVTQTTLDTVSSAESRAQIGPGQYFVCGAPTESERCVESLAILLDENQVYPAIMKNPVGYPLEGCLVDPDEVEMLGLERFTKEELKGWDYINLLELDLTGREDSRPIYAVEQQLQHKMEWQDLGYQRLNRVAGAGPWNNKPRGTVMVGFEYAPRGWLQEHYHEIAIVRGKMRGGGQDGTKVDLTGLGGILWASKLRTTGMLLYRQWEKDIIVILFTFLRITSKRSVIHNPQV